MSRVAVETIEGKRILLVEDHEDSAEILRLFLEAEGCQVQWAPTAAAALAAFDGRRRPPPDLVLLDLTLPDLDGVELGRRLRALPQPPPVLLLSGKSQHALSGAAATVDAVGYVRKPFSAGGLLDAVAAALERRTSAIP